MPNFNIIKTSKFEQTFRNKSIIGQFDLQIEEIKEQFYGNIAIENAEWQIGCIVGASGSGKSTIAQQLWPDEYIDHFTYPNDRSILDSMPDELLTSTITRCFNSVGFATVWSWLKPYNVLSNGERMRVDLARALLENRSLIVFDEFTSVVDRTIAKTSSQAISKAIRKTDKQFIAVTCHKDIIDWLQPDWVYDTDQQKFFFVQSPSPNLRLNCDRVVPKYGHYLENIII